MFSYTGFLVALPILLIYGTGITGSAFYRLFCLTGYFCTGTLGFCFCFYKFCWLF
jgi:hypothetical protein